MRSVIQLQIAFVATCGSVRPRRKPFAHCTRFVAPQLPKTSSRVRGEVPGGSATLTRGPSSETARKVVSSTGRPPTDVTTRLSLETVPEGETASVATRPTREAADMTDGDTKEERGRTKAPEATPVPHKEIPHHILSVPTTEGTGRDRKRGRSGGRRRNRRGYRCTH